MNINACGKREKRIMHSGCLSCLWCALATPEASVPDEEALAKHSSARPINEAELIYPKAAEVDGLHGDVIAVVDVDIFGNVTAVKVIEGHQVFHEAAIEAARSLKFEPARVRGEAVTASVRVFFHFTPPQEATEHDPIEVMHTAQMPI